MGCNLKAQFVYNEVVLLLRKIIIVPIGLFFTAMVILAFVVSPVTKPDAWSGWLGGLLGAFIGSALALILAYDIFRTESRQNRRLEQQKNATELRRLILQISFRMNKLKNLQDLRFIEHSVSKDRAISISGIYHSIHQSIDEISTNIRQASIDLRIFVNTDPIMDDKTRSLSNQCMEYCRFVDDYNDDRLQKFYNSLRNLIGDISSESHMTDEDVKKVYMELEEMRRDHDFSLIQKSLAAHWKWAFSTELPKG